MKSYIAQLAAQFINKIKYEEGSTAIQSPISQRSNHTNILINKLADNSLLHCKSKLILDCNKE